MKNLGKFLAASALAVALAVGGSGVAAHATYEYPYGGIWAYGVRSGGVYGTMGETYSYYYHETRSHKSTACSAVDCDYTLWVSAGSTSIAIVGATDFRNTAYYGVR